LLSLILKTRLEVYPNIFITLRIMLNCPDTAASNERSFIKLKLIKTNLQQVLYERLQTVLMSRAVSQSFMCALSRFG